ncbi:ABC-type transport auxiliary lipoprotein family protein [Paraburkholderia bonniea]|uniref:ABC-type transport auxiliary lipoprotein family protein n=1 Tax=Paraburkholderia bonniea TaxID=2152891 RepID=UPI00129098D6|nr:ABC-type transport auxiliary lipoprotein family protein [Paraburkholderia bonniea]WJF90068.1 ABC-type transport auxiliary lipoprotein family protein [Paraburkholderia bonniea]WJF93382.1 ABC-type transport auxiliary lipoprotein family protein [Paraburkholderia bonniea]
MRFFCSVVSGVSGRRLSAGAALAGLVLLAGCAGTPAALSNLRYDLGPPSPPVTAGTLPAVKVLDMVAPTTLETDKMIYRLGYVDAQQTSAYVNSRWTMPPAQLLTQRLRMALSAHGPVLNGSDGVRAPMLKVSLDEFEQIFDGRAQSHGAVSARVTLLSEGVVLGQRTFIARAPASTPDAAGGAQALAAASADLVAQIAVWVSAQMPARSPVAATP